MGPLLNHRLRYVWLGGAVFLALLILSVSFLVLQTIEKLSNVALERQALLLAPLLMVVIVLGFALIVSWCVRTPLFTGVVLRLLGAIAVGAAIVAIIAAAILFVFNGLGCYPQDVALIGGLKAVSMYLLPLGVAFVACRILMGRNGAKPLSLVYVGSIVFFLIYVGFLWSRGGSIADAICRGWVPWSLASEWTAVVAWVVIAIYVIANAAFLTPYLGDAARYFRNSPANVEGRRTIRKQAVDMLAYLHECDRYDRIVVVAHSLGTVVAYDMLRAYYSRIHHSLPDPAALQPALGEVDGGKLTCEQARAKGRAIIKAMIGAAKAKTGTKTWLVTDFVTLGSPLAHAEYLMCRGTSREELADDLARRKKEREFPTCPPEEQDDDGWLTFDRPGVGRRFHHAGLFGMTRWTNLHFPMAQLLWGDAIGGPVAPVFGRYVVEREVHTRSADQPDFFAHTTYWDVALRQPDKPLPPHIAALQEAINLADK
ncbi:MAG: hypothetical protein AB7O50_00535 [Pseudolabrys sp.]